MSAAQAGMASPRRVRSASPRGRPPSMIGSPRDYASSMGSPRGTPRAASPVDVLVFFQNSRIAAVAPKGFELRDKHLLPDEIFFFVCLASNEFARSVAHELPPRGFLHRAAGG